MRKSSASLAFVLLLIVMLMAADAYALSFRKIRIESGLSHDNVSCLLQDSFGFVWIGTSNGLNCYYGNHNKVFRNDDERSVDLPSNQIISLLDAAPDSLWVGTSRGLCLYNRFTGTFTPFAARTVYGVSIGSEVCSLLRGADGTVWIGTLGQGLFRYDGRRLEQYLVETSFATDLAADVAGNVYVASMNRDVLVYTPRGRLKEAIQMPSAVRCLYASPQGLIYVGMEQGVAGLLAGGEQQLYPVGDVKCLQGDADGNLLVGTGRGLYFLPSGTEHLLRVDNASADNGLSVPQVSALMTDREGGIWVGTEGGGVNYMTGQSRVFRSYYLPENHRKETVAAFCETPDSTLYIGTDRGMYVLPRGKSSVQRFVPANGSPGGVCAFRLEGDHLWLGTYRDGLLRMDLRSRSLRAFPVQPGMSGRVSCVRRGSNGRLFIGTDNGLWHLNEATGLFEQDHTLGFMIVVEDMCEDSLQNLWIATSQDGIYRHTLHNGHWRHYRRNPKQGEGGLFSDNVNALKIDRRGRLWIGTDGNGFGWYDPETDSFVRHEDGSMQQDEAAAHVIRAIEQDRQGSLWAIDGQGLSRFYVENDTVGARTWTADNGLPFSNFGVHAALCLSDGRMAFGGEGGLTLFDPQELKFSRSPSAVHIIGIDFPYEQAAEASDDFPDYGLMASLPGELELPYACNSFQLTFSSTGYESPEKTLYRYRFGNDTQVWTQPAPVDVASFTDLAPGTYHLRVEAANADGVWSRHPAEMTIVIRPPWWQGTAARLLYAFLVLGGVACAAWAWNAHVKRKYRERMKRAEAVRQQETYRQKINFFVNLVHEIRTPLSLIRLPLEQIRESGGQTEENMRLLSLVDKNVDYLLNVSNQLLDLQKLENGDNFMLRLETCDVGALTDNLQFQFADSARLRGVDFTIERPEGPMEAGIDRDKIYKILVNLASNALKYARSRIVVSLSQEADGTLRWTVDDDGPGIPPEERKKVFQTFYRIEAGTAAPAGTGIGLSYAHALATRHGGDLYADDSPLGGARFVLSLSPQADAGPQEASQPSEEQALAAEEVTGELERRDFCVLVVEDNAELLKLTTRSLAKWFRIQKAANGQQALDLLNADGCDVDVVVSDVMMPVMDGLELCRRVKEDISTSHLPFIMLTAKTTLEAKADGLSCGADAYVEKPFSIRQLKAQIDNLLRLRQAFHRRMSSMGQGALSGESSQHLGDGLNERDREFVERLEQLILERISEESLSIDGLASDLNISRSNFYRKIRALTGMAPADYLRWVRLNRATELLRQGERIGDVIYKVGFNSPSYFSKCFKERFGCTPRDYLSSRGASADGAAE